MTSDADALAAWRRRAIAAETRIGLLRQWARVRMERDPGTDPVGQQIYADAAQVEFVIAEGRYP